MNCKYPIVQDAAVPQKAINIILRLRGTTVKSRRIFNLFYLYGFYLLLTYKSLEGYH